MRNYFLSDETKCRCGCGINNVSQLHLKRMNESRVYYGKAILTTSTCRCPKHNEKEGGSEISAHLTTKDKKCFATDVVIPRAMKDKKILLSCLLLRNKRVGINEKEGYFHVDNDPDKPEGLFFY